MLQGYAAAADDVVREVVSRRYLALQRTVVKLTGCGRAPGAHVLRDRAGRDGLDRTRTPGATHGHHMGRLAAGARRPRRAAKRQLSCPSPAWITAS